MFNLCQDQAALQGLIVEEVHMRLEVEASASIITATTKAALKHCKTDIEKTISQPSPAPSSTFIEHFLIYFVMFSMLNSKLPNFYSQR